MKYIEKFMNYMSDKGFTLICFLLFVMGSVLSIMSFILAVKSLWKLIII